MKKFIAVESGEEIKVGDKVGFATIVELPFFGKVKSMKIQTLTNKLLKKLIKSGQVKVVDEEQDSQTILWNKIISNLNIKTGWDNEKLGSILNTFKGINLWAVLQIILKEAAIELDKKYENHIKESEHIYVISPQDGRIHEINKANIKSYKAFPAFRTIEDAKIACSFIGKELKSLFSNAKK